MILHHAAGRFEEFFELQITSEDTYCFHFRYTKYQINSFRRQVSVPPAVVLELKSKIEFLDIRYDKFDNLILMLIFLYFFIFFMPTNLGFLNQKMAQK